jgi:Flp pilus assembly protein TadG
MKTCSTIWLAMRGCAAGLIADCRGVAATEFAVVVPIMLVLFFGTVEFSSGVAVDRKVTLMARTLSDLTSQSPNRGVSDADLTNFFEAAGGIMTPYDVTPMRPTISEIYVDASGKATIQWSKSATIALVSGAPVATLTTSARSPGNTITIPPTLAIPNTYLIFSEVSYLYTPTLGYVMAKAGINLSNLAYTRPRQSLCVAYPATTNGSAGTCTQL